MVTEEVREQPMWQSWVLHRKLLMFVTRHSIGVGEVEDLRQLVDDYLQAFDKVSNNSLSHTMDAHSQERLCAFLAQVEEYKSFWRPKHHFLKHLPSALRDFGPLREVWCMPWEGFLQVRISK